MNAFKNAVGMVGEWLATVPVKIYFGCLVFVFLIVYLPGEVGVKYIRWIKPEKSDYIIAALLGAGVTFLGTRLTLGHQSKLKERELHHEAREKERERQLSLKKDAYLPFMEALNLELNSVSDLISSPLDKPLTSTSATELSRRLSHLPLVAPRTVVDKATKTVFTLSQIRSQIIKRRLIWGDTFNAIRKLERLIEGELIKMKKLSRLANVEPEEKNQRRKEIDRRYIEFQAKRTEMVIDLEEKKLKAIESMRDSFVPLLSFMAPMEIAIRDDLGIESDSQWLHDYHEARFLTVSSQLDGQAMAIKRNISRGKY